MMGWHGDAANANPMGIVALHGTPWDGSWMNRQQIQTDRSCDLWITHSGLSRALVIEVAIRLPPCLDEFRKILIVALDAESWPGSVGAERISQCVDGADPRRNGEEADVKCILRYLDSKYPGAVNSASVRESIKG